MASKIKLITFITFILAGIFFVSNEYLGGYLSHFQSKYGLQNEISSPSGALYEWKLADKSPFKYRLLFPAIVKGSWQLLPDKTRGNASFYVLYKGWSLVFFVISGIAFFWLLITLGFSGVWAFLGCMLYAISPPILLAYSLPVHTREDTLGYTLLCLGLICLIRQKIPLMIGVAVLAVLCRETLLLLPFVFLFFSDYRTFLVRAGWAACPVAVWLAIRAWLGGNPYDPWEGLRWNLANAGQALGFTWLTFGYLWPLFLYGLYRRKYALFQAPHHGIKLLYRSGGAVCGLVLITTFIGGIYNEIRLLFLMFPWVIGIAVHILSLHRHQIVAVATQKRYLALVLVSLLSFVWSAVWAIDFFAKYFEGSSYPIRFDIWIVMTLFSLWMTVLLLPIFLQIFVRTSLKGEKFANPLR